VGRVLLLFWKEIDVLIIQGIVHDIILNSMQNPYNLDSRFAPVGASACPDKSGSATRRDRGNDNS
jgi:hypothetical protein